MLKILIVCVNMFPRTGSPLYNYTLAMELKRQGHDISMFSMWEENDLKHNLEKAGVKIFYEPIEAQFDLILISQEYHKEYLKKFKANKVINIVHSEYDCENPIISDVISHYIAIRPSIKEHLNVSHNIGNDRIDVIYNGVDFERFSPLKRKVNDNNFIKVVIPCTLDMLREKFINYYIKKSNARFQVHFYGRSFGNIFCHSDFAFFHDEVPDIENYICDADIVSGILLGRINLEAKAMGIVSYIHNPEKPEEYSIYYPQDDIFNQRHDIKNVAIQIIELYDKLSSKYSNNN